MQDSGAPEERTNALFVKYYQASRVPHAHLRTWPEMMMGGGDMRLQELKIVPEEEWPIFMATLQRLLPATFRITGTREYAGPHTAPAGWIGGGLPCFTRVGPPASQLGAGGAAFL
jgi:hypothetical protein